MPEKTWLPTGNFALLTKEQTALLGSLIGLARVCANNTTGDDTEKMIAESLLCLHRESGIAEKATELREKVIKHKYGIVPDCAVCRHPCGNTSDFNIAELRIYPEKSVYLKEVLADMIIENAPTALRMTGPGIESAEYFRELEYGLFVIGEDFTDGGIYDAIERVNTAKEKAESMLHEFFARF
ncbi:MAG: hypothetical protein Q4C42_00340 [Clostridia bacterium]|nr:hypothetical protein [Clostridia bacterium]